MLQQMHKYDPYSHQVQKRVSHFMVLNLASSRWLRQMIAKKKFKFLDIPIWDELWDKIEYLTTTDNERSEMLKDLRLIEAAIAIDKIVISLDDNTARKFFIRAASQVDKLKNIVWVPDKIAQEKTIEWLKNGAEPESDRLLGTCNKFES